MRPHPNLSRTNLLVSPSKANPVSSFISFSSLLSWTNNSSLSCSKQNLGFKSAQHLDWISPSRLFLFGFSSSSRPLCISFSPTVVSFSLLFKLHTTGVDGTSGRHLITEMFGSFSSLDSTSSVRWNNEAVYILHMSICPASLDYYELQGIAGEDTTDSY